jgi:hypothetical protein
MAKQGRNINGVSVWWFGVPCIVLLILVVISPVCLSQHGPEWLNLSSDSSAKIGDSIGGITAPFVGVLAVLATFWAFWAQYEYNKLQYRFIIKEQFDHAFYEMLAIHESITDSLRMVVVNANNQAGQLTAQPEEAVLMGRAVFSYMYEDMTAYEDERGGRFTYAGKKQYVGLKGLFEGNEDPYPIYETNRAVSGLDHYFRQLYNIFKMIHENQDFDVSTKYYYASIVRSTLSQYELVLLFHNCLSANGRDRFKPLVEEYAILNNIREDLLANTARLDMYRETAYIVKRNIK